MLKKLQRDSLLLGNCSGPLTGKTLSAVTHTINALTALNYLGASDKRLCDFFNNELESYINNDCSDNTSSVGFEELNVDDLIGTLKSEDITKLAFYYSNLFENLDCEKKRKFLKECVVKLMPGLGGAAYHGTILLGWLLQDGDEENLLLGEAISYMTIFYEPIAIIDSNENGTKSLEEILVSINKDGKFKNAFEPSWRNLPVFQQRYSKLVKDYSNILLEYVSQWNISTIDNAISEIILCATKAFILSGADDFFLLHGVTSSFATRNIVSYFGPNEENEKIMFLRYYALTLLVAYICEGCVDLEQNITEKTIPWEDISSQIISDESCNNDAHLIKLVAACKLFNKELNLDTNLFQIAASLA